MVNRSICARSLTTSVILGAVVSSFALIPLLGRSYFPRTDPGSIRHQHQDCPSGTGIEVSNQYIAQVEERSAR